MLITVLLVLHIAVLGYWLGSELVINATYRFVCFDDRMDFAARDRLMDHVMHVDQHVRYALVLQAGLGTMLAALSGLLPGGEGLAVAAGAAALGWLAFVEIVHRLRHRPAGARLALIDRWSRHLLILLLLAIALGLVGAGWGLPAWLRWKLALFAVVMACGVGIRLALIAHFRTWAVMRRDGPTAAANAIIRRTYWRATSVLGLLWLCIIAMVILSIAKPG